MNTHGSGADNKGLKMNKRCSCKKSCHHPLWGRVTVHGKRSWVNTREPTPAKALDVLAQARTRIAEGLAPVQAQLLVGDLQALAGGNASRWKTLLRFWDPTSPVETISSLSVRRFVLLRRTTVRGQTIARELCLLHRGLLAAQEAGLTSHDVRFPRLKHDAADEAKRGHRLPMTLVRQVVEMLTPAAADAVTFATLTGVRSAELGRVTLLNVQDRAGHPVLVLGASMTKTRRERTIPLPAAALDALKRHPGGFSATWDAELVSASVSLSQEPRVKLRDLRHTYASEVAESVSIQVAQRLLGHSSIRTTQRYVDATAEAYEAADAVGRKWSAA